MTKVKEIDTHLTAALLIEQLQMVPGDTPILCGIQMAHDVYAPFSFVKSGIGKMADLSDEAFWLITNQRALIEGEPLN